MPSCDSCSLCCKVMKISELEKPAHQWCAHCEIAAGCQISDSRPQSCRDYECLWLKSQALDRPMPAALRPDKSRVVMGTVNQGEEVVLYLSPDRPEAWKNSSIKKLIGDFQNRGIPVSLSFGETLQRL